MRSQAPAFASRQRLIDMSNPVDWQHPATNGLVGWWKVIGNPGCRGSNTLRDLMRGGGHSPNDLALTGTLGTGAKWQGNSQPNSPGSLQLDGTTGYASVAAAVISGTPLTLCAWWNSAQTGGLSAGVVMGVDTSNGSARFVLTVGTSGQLGVVSATAANSANSSASATSGSTTANTWYFSVAPFASATSRTIYVFGGNGYQTATNGNSITPTGLNRTIIGARASAGVTGAFFPGYVSEGMIFNRVLTKQEAFNLYQLGHTGYPGVLNYLGTTEYSLPPLRSKGVLTLFGPSGVGSIIIANA